MLYFVSCILFCYYGYGPRKMEVAWPLWTAKVLCVALLYTCPPPTPRNTSAWLCALLKRQEKTLPFNSLSYMFFEELFFESPKTDSSSKLQGLSALSVNKFTLSSSCKLGSLLRLAWLSEYSRWSMHFGHPWPGLESTTIELTRSKTVCTLHPAVIWMALVSVNIPANIYQSL